jgi:hypothetical protein
MFPGVRDGGAPSSVNRLLFQTMIVNDLNW